jgi:hypothetical protein
MTERISPDAIDWRLLERLKGRILEARRQAQASRSGEPDVAEVAGRALLEAFDLGVDAARRPRPD